MLLTLQNKWLAYQEQTLEQRKKILQRKQALKSQLQECKQKPKKLETSKLVLWFMLAILICITTFTGFVTLVMMNVAAATNMGMDFTPLVALITSIVGEVILVLGYFAKSAKENCAGGVVYEAAVNSLQEGEDYAN